MKRIIAAVLLIIALLSLASCAKCIKTEITEVNVEFVEAYYKSASTYFIPMRVGKTTIMSPRTRPAEYNVIVKYKGKTYTFDDYDFFQKHEYDERGQTFIMNWVIKYYDDDTAKSELRISDSN